MIGRPPKQQPAQGRRLREGGKPRDAKCTPTSRVCFGIQGRGGGGEEWGGGGGRANIQCFKDEVDEPFSASHLWDIPHRRRNSQETTHALDVNEHIQQSKHKQSKQNKSDAIPNTLPPIERSSLMRKSVCGATFLISVLNTRAQVLNDCRTIAAPCLMLDA